MNLYQLHSSYLGIIFITQILSTTAVESCPNAISQNGNCAFDDDLTEEMEIRHILLLGLSGSGKSATLNFLLNQTIAEVEEFGSSSEAELTEYLVPLSKSISLKITDTPGILGDSGVEQDARILSTLEEYLEENQKEFNVPHYVLIFARFDDDSLIEEGSPNSKFVKMLKSFHILKDLFEDSPTNLIFVLTNVLGGSEIERKNPQAKINEFKRLIREYTTFESPYQIVLAENKADEGELREVLNAGYVLPNGEIYPQNLKEKLTEISNQKNDPIGKALFTSTDYFNETSSFEKTFQQRSFSLLFKNSPQVVKMLIFLNNMDVNFEETEISERLGKTFESYEPRIKNQNQESLEYLQKYLNLRSFTRLAQIPIAKHKVAKLVKNMKKDDFALNLFEKGLGMKVPKLPITSPLVGNLYNSISEQVSTKSPFGSGKFKLSDSGFKIPSIVSMRRSEEEKFHYHFFDTKSDYFSGKYPHFLMRTNEKRKLPSGYNLKGERFLTASYEVRLFEMFIHVQDHKRILNRDLMIRVRNLPAFNESQFDSLFKWESFFHDFGTHFISSAFVGGTVMFEFEDVISNTNMTTVEELVDEIINEDVNYKFTIKGGNPKKHFSTIRVFSSFYSTKAGKKMLRKWRESLNDYPEMLESEIKLSPISSLFLERYFHIALDMDKALHFFSRQAGAVGELQGGEIQRLHNQTANLNDELIKRNIEETTVVAKLKQDIQNFQAQNSELSKTLTGYESSFRECELSIKKLNYSLVGAGAEATSALNSLEDVKRQMSECKLNVIEMKSHLHQGSSKTLDLQSEHLACQSKLFALEDKVNRHNSEIEEVNKLKTMCDQAPAHPIFSVCHFHRNQLIGKYKPCSQIAI